jgi:hypothetical protein
MSQSAKLPSRMEEVHVVDLEVGLDEGLPVDVVLVDAH